MVKLKTFDEHALQSIEAAVKNAEQKTSGEIVVLTVPASDSYAWLVPLCGFIGFLGPTLFFTLLSFQNDWFFPLKQILASQCGSAILAMVLALFAPLRRLLIPQKLKAENVHRECLASFTALGLTETRDRTGILLYFSELEHQVEILADKGIHTVVGEAYWKDQIAHIVKGIHEGRAAEAVSEAIHQIGDKLATHFPRKVDDTNELSDSVRPPPK